MSADFCDACIFERKNTHSESFAFEIQLYCINIHFSLLERREWCVMNGKILKKSI